MDPKSPIYQRSISIRSSCDRCRLHKLKCTISYKTTYAGSSPCDRCSRAKTTCVFSRRATPRRPDRTKISATKREDDGSGLTAVTHEADPGLYFQGSANKPLLFGTQPCGTHDWNSSNVEGPPDIVVDDIGPVHPGIYFWNEDGSIRTTGAEWRFPDPANFANPVILNKQDMRGGVIPIHNCRDDSPSKPLLVPPDASKMGVSDGMSEDGNVNRIRRLANLIAEIADTRLTLEDSLPSHRSEVSGLNDYPIGRVLHLSQQFINILSSGTPEIRNTQPLFAQGPALSSAYPETQDPSSYYTQLRTTHIASGDPSDAQADSFSSLLSTQSLNNNPSLQEPLKIQECVDTSTMLIVLSCYVSLVKLYGIVFTHFEAYLNSLSTAETAPGPVESDLTCNRQLQLGELPTGDEACRKIIAATRILLSMLASIEDRLGVPDDLTALREPGDKSQGKLSHGIGLNTWKDRPPWTTSQRELMLVILRQDSEIRQGKAEGGFLDVLTKFQSLKKVLRERMDL
ncbi:hypothetical protein F5Y10DRAFT_289479 [Nemania abortiva]|nr:hypothetical protein F5Y10DRAFT_289479 [Nemania abortiva]